MVDFTETLKMIQKQVPNLQAVYLFGSTGTAYETSESDVDIAVLASSPLDPLQRWHLAQDIAYYVNRDVDIVDLREASTVMRAEIINSGKRLFVKDALQADLFETTAFSMYVHFNEDRQELLTDIKNRGGQILNG